VLPLLTVARNRRTLSRPESRPQMRPISRMIGKPPEIMAGTLSTHLYRPRTEQMLRMLHPNKRKRNNRVHPAGHSTTMDACASTRSAKSPESRRGLRTVSSRREIPTATRLDGLHPVAKVLPLTRTARALVGVLAGSVVSTTTAQISRTGLEAWVRPRSTGTAAPNSETTSLQQKLRLG
jgi:hypothetical protein